MANKSKHMKKEDEKENVFKLDIGKNTRKRVVAKSTLKKKNKQKDKEEKFNFDNEIVIGVNVIPDVKKDKPSKNNKEGSKKNNISKSNKSSNKKNEPKKSINKDNKNQKEKYRNKKNKLNVKKIIKIFLIIAITIGIAIFIMTTPLFNVTEIDISGNSRISKERIESLSQIKLDVNTYQYSKNNIVNKLKEEPYIESVVVKRKLPNKIQIDIIEREPSYIIQYLDTYIYISNQGYILEVSDESLNIPFITGYSTKQEDLVVGNRLCDEDLEKLNTLLKIIETAENNGINNKISNIDMADKNNYIIKLESEQKIVYLGNATNINDRMLMLKEILTKEAGNTGEIFIKDLNKIYFRQQV